MKVKSKVKNLTLIFKFWLKSKKCRKSVKILRFRIRLLRKTAGKILIISTEYSTTVLINTSKKWLLPNKIL